MVKKMSKQSQPNGGDMENQPASRAEKKKKKRVNEGELCEKQQKRAELRSQKLEPEGGGEVARAENQPASREKKSKPQVDVGALCKQQKENAESRSQKPEGVVELAKVVYVTEIWYDANRRIIGYNRKERGEGIKEIYFNKIEGGKILSSVEQSDDLILRYETYNDTKTIMLHMQNNNSKILTFPDTDPESYNQFCEFLSSPQYQAIDISDSKGVSLTR